MRALLPLLLSWLLAAAAACEAPTAAPAEEAMPFDAGHADAAGDPTPDAATDADTLAAPLPAELVASLDAALAAHTDAVGAPGLAVRVSLPGYAPWDAAAGLATTDPLRAAEPADRFRVGSITKTFVTALVLRLVADGVLALDDPADTWIPGFDLGPAITLRRLLDHTSGIFNYSDDPDFLLETQQDTPPEAVIAWALQHGPVHAPGAAWSYTNTGFFLLGLVVEAATGEPLVTRLHGELLDPRSLSDTFLEGDEPIPGGTAQGHLLGGDPLDGFSMSWAWAAGGAVSTVDDLCRWLGHLYLGDVVPPDLRDAMLAPARLDGGSTVGYGLGTYLRTRSGLPVAGHTGSTMGFRGTAFVHRASGACVAVLTNDFFAEPEQLEAPLWDALAPWLADDARLARPR